MVRIKPFPSFRPQPNLAAQIASLPYDVVTTGEARELAQDNPLSFLHVVRSEIDLPVGTHPYDTAVYDKARENLQRLLSQHALVEDTTPKLYLYRQVLDHRSQTGLVCCCHLEDYEQNRIRKHEKTRREKEDDRTRHVLAINANSGPIFSTYRDDQRINKLVEEEMNARPLYHFDAVDDVTHTVWTVQNPQRFVDLFGQIPHVYIADGHHRAASAARAAAERRRENPGHRGDEEYTWFLSALFPASQLSILPYHRVLRDLNGMTSGEALKKLGEVGTLRRTDNPSPERPATFCFFLAGEWHRLELPPSTIDTSDPVESLDVALLHNRLLQPIFGIGDPRTDERIDFVGGIRGIRELERRVNKGEAAMAISMYATSIDQLLRVADAGLVMPPKSTWFEPKLRSGLFVHPLG